MRRPAALTAALTALALAGCGAQSGTGDFEGEDKRVAQVVVDLEEAATKSDERRICRQLLTTDLVRSLGDCNAAVDDALKVADTPEMTVEKVDVTGTTATAEVQFGRDPDAVRRIELAKEGDAWKLADLGEPAS